MVFPLIMAAFSAISTAVTSIGPGVASFCANVLPKLAPLLNTGLEALKTVANIAQLVANLVGVFNPGEKTEDIGDRALQAAEKGITPDQFDDHSEYMANLRSFELDPEKSEKISPETKIIAGLAIAGRGIDEKFGQPDGTTGQIFVLAGSDPGYFNAERLTQFLQTGQSIGDIVDYFSGKLGGAESLETEDKLVALDQATSPQQDEQSIRNKIYGTAETVQAH